MRDLDSIELASMTITTPALAWQPVARGGTFLIAARVATWDARGELRGLSGFEVGQRLYRVGRRRVPWTGLNLLRDLDADDRTQVVVTVDAPPLSSDPYWLPRRTVRLRDRLAEVRSGAGRDVLVPN